MGDISITGENGFLGGHLKNHIKNHTRYKFRSLGKNFFKSLSNLKDGDFLFHTASVHRNKNPELVYEINMDINKKLINILNSHNLSINIIFMSSIQEKKDNPYGRSKIDGKLLIREYCMNRGTKFISHKLPNIFGPNAKPNKTSFIATFSYNIFNNIDSYYNSNIVELSYVDDIINKISKLSWEKINFKSKKISVKDVYFLLLDFKNKIDTNKK